MRFLKHLPWLVLFLVLVSGTVLWLLFVNDQQLRLKGTFQNQLERLSDSLLRGHMEGRLGPGGLPEGVGAFAVYRSDGSLAIGWGTEIPGSLGPGIGFLPGEERLILTGNQAEFVRTLVPMGPRVRFWESPPPPGPPPPRELQGFLFLRVTATPLFERIWGWYIGGALGTFAWAGFVTFTGVLWFRTRRYQETLVQNRELLQFAEASRTLGHELQNPLAAILLQTALLKRSAGGTPPPEVTVIEEEARRMSSLVARVRDFLKDPAGNPGPVDLGALAVSLKERFPAQVAVETPGTPVTVLFEKERLRSVVENLVKNAVETGAGTEVLIQVSIPRPGAVRLEVFDSGPGFSPEAIRKALNPFFTTKTTGSGIGLSIADNFVRAAGGKLRLGNRPEGGAWVTVDLPGAPREDRP